MAIAKNPLDVVFIYGNPNARTLVGDIIEIMANDNNIDIIIPGLTVGGPVATEIIENTMKSIKIINEKHGKPVIFWWAIDRESFRSEEKTFSEHKVPLYRTPEQAVFAASVMHKYSTSCRFTK